MYRVELQFVHTFLLRFCRIKRDFLPSLFYWKRLVYSLGLVLKKEKTKYLRTYCQKFQKSVQPQGHFHPSSRGQGHHGGHQQPLVWFFNLFAQFFLKKLKVLGPKTPFVAKKQFKMPKKNPWPCPWVVCRFALGHIYAMGGLGGQKPYLNSKFWKKL